MSGRNRPMISSGGGANSASASHPTKRRLCNFGLQKTPRSIRPGEEHTEENDHRPDDLRERYALVKHQHGAQDRDNGGEKAVNHPFRDAKAKDSGAEPDKAERGAEDGRREPGG